MNTKNIIFVNNAPAKFYLNKTDNAFVVVVTLDVKETCVDLFRCAYATFYGALAVLLEKLAGVDVSEQTSCVEEAETGFDLSTLLQIIEQVKKSEQ